MNQTPDGGQPVIVAAALVRDRAVLLARRTRPKATAGMWEMPGGKVEPGETDTQALQREITEELGVAIEVGGFVAEHPIPGVGTLRVYLAGILDDAEPRLLDHHDQLRWVREDQVRRARALPLAPGDESLLPAVLALIDDASGFARVVDR